MTLPRTASLLLSHIRSPRWLQASSSFPAGQSRMQPRISEQDRGNEHPTPSNGTEVYWWGLSQNYAAFLYDKWHLYAVTGKLVRKHKECMLDPGTEQSLILSGSLGKKPFSKSSNSLKHSQRKWVPLIPHLQLFLLTSTRSHWRLRSLP